MRHFKLLALFVAVLMLAIVGVQAQETEKGTEKVTEKEAVKEAAPEFKNQTNCPVMGGKIDSSVYTDIQGQRVYHCCGGCSGALKKDPDKFFKKAAEEGIRYENIQTSCPVSGKELKEKTLSVDYEGRTIYICCEGCRAKFLKDSAKFLVAMDAPGKEEASTEMHKLIKGDEGHTHGPDGHSHGEGGGHK